MGGRWKAKIDWTIIYNKKKKKMGAKPGTNIKAKVMQWARVLLLIIKTLQVLAVLTVSFRSIFLFLIWSPRPDELKTAHNFWNSRAWNLNFQRDEAFHKLRGCTHTDYAYWCWFMKLFQSACRSWLPSVHLKMSWDVWCSPCLRSKYLHAHENKHDPSLPLLWFRAWKEQQVDTGGFFLSGRLCQLSCCHHHGVDLTRFELQSYRLICEYS